jgi:hypothetical protein
MAPTPSDEQATESRLFIAIEQVVLYREKVALFFARRKQIASSIAGQTIRHAEIENPARSNERR